MLYVHHLEKTLENHTVLSIEKITIEAGEVVALIAPVENGKTTLIQVLSGLLPPGSGSVLLADQDIYQVPQSRQYIGTLFEEDLLYERQSAQANLLFYAQIYNLPRQRVTEALERIGLNDRKHDSVHKLSPSFQRRIAFARAFLNQPRLLLLDQPTNRTDLATQQLFSRMIQEAAQTGSAVLLTEEDLGWAGKFCSRILELEKGYIIADTPNRQHLPLPSSSKQAPSDIPSDRLIPFKVPARKEDRIMLYDPSDLLYITSRDGKTLLRTAHEEATTNLTLQELEARLHGRGFFKAHRAYLVNLQHIKAVIQYTRNSYTLLLNDPEETMIPLSKQCERDLQALLNY